MEYLLALSALANGVQGMLLWVESNRIKDFQRLVEKERLDAEAKRLSLIAKHKETEKKYRYDVNELGERIATLLDSKHYLESELDEKAAEIAISDALITSLEEKLEKQKEINQEDNMIASSQMDVVVARMNRQKAQHKADYDKLIETCAEISNELAYTRNTVAGIIEKAYVKSNKQKQTVYDEILEALKEGERL